MQIFTDFFPYISKKDGYFGQKAVLDRRNKSRPSQVRLIEVILPQNKVISYKTKTDKVAISYLYHPSSAETMP